jgi:hypothetical protein
MTRRHPLCVHVVEPAESVRNEARLRGANADSRWSRPARETKVELAGQVDIAT